MFRFSKASFNAMKPSLINTFYNFVAILAVRSAEHCHGNFVIAHMKLNINAEILHQNKEVIILTLLGKLKNIALSY